MLAIVTYESTIYSIVCCFLVSYVGHSIEMCDTAKIRSAVGQVSIS